MRILVFMAFMLLSTSFNNNYTDNYSYQADTLIKQSNFGAVKGTIELPKKSLRKVIRKRRSRRYGRNVLQLAKSARKFNEYEKSMVYLEPLDSRLNTPENVPQILSQSDVSFQPAHLVVQRGADVNVLNRDNIFHNVFSESSVKSFNIGKVRKNVDKVIQFESTGHITVFCDIHAFMSAIISIVDTPYFTTCDEKGNFEIRNVPEGRYKLYGWHSRSEYQATLIEVKSGRFTVIKQMEFN